MIGSSELRKILNLRRQARRWMVVAYWVVVLSYIAALAIAGRGGSQDQVDRPFFWFWWTLIAFPMFLRGLVTFSTRGSDLQSLLQPAKSGTGLEPRPMDERELGLHYRMHTKAYYLLQKFVPVGVLLLTPPEIHQSAWLISTRIPMLWLLSMVVSSLPQSMILWTQPDVEPEA